MTKKPDWLDDSWHISGTRYHRYWRKTLDGDGIIEIVPPTFEWGPLYERLQGKWYIELVGGGEHEEVICETEEEVKLVYISWLLTGHLDAQTD